MRKSHQLGSGEDPIHFFFQTRIILGHFVGVAEFFSDEIRADGGQDRFKIGDIGDDCEIDPVDLAGIGKPASQTIIKSP